MKKRIFALILALTIAFSLSAAFPAMADENDDTQAQTITITLSDLSQINKFGNITFTEDYDEFTAAGYEYADYVDVSFLGKTVTMPVCENFSGVDSGNPALLAGKKDNGSYMQLVINMGNFADYYEIATETINPDKTFYWTANEGVDIPLTFTITMNKKGGYYDEYILHNLVYSDIRENYPDLTDAEFANFRNVATTGMGKNILYRSASTINPVHNRNTYADAATKDAGVTVIMNLADNTDTAKTYPGYTDSYYSTVKTIELNLGIDMTSAEYKQGLAEGFRFFAANPGVYEVQCIIGRDRTGQVCALLEALMGATAQEIVDDYMVSFYNFSGVTKDDARYKPLADSNIVKTLQNIFGVSDIYSADLSACAYSYISSLGLSDDEIAALKHNLSVNNVNEETSETTQAQSDETSASQTGETSSNQSAETISDQTAASAQTTAASSQKESPKTGDTDSILIWAILMLAACSSVGVVLKRSQK